ncbi:hypothetical protein LCGC14_2202770 [marine sediment metagenome]|uniref:Uncharacterized protein n=1 Tax=marine sediment metagenome TaxID=412755 RepID=A0A0F9GBX9_9ZZZZ
MAKLASSSYVGNGIDDRSITGVGFQPTWVLIKGNAAKYVWHKTPRFSGLESQRYSGVTSGIDQIQAFEADGFQLGLNVDVNSDGTTYFHQALLDGGDSDLDETLYTGDGNDDRSVTGAGFAPLFALVFSDDETGSETYFRTASMTAGESQSVIVAEAELNGIQDLEADGIQVGTLGGVNADTKLYAFIAIKDTNSADEGQYTGDGNDDRSISGVGFQPTWVCTKRDNASNFSQRMKMGVNTGDVSFHVGSSANAPPNHCYSLPLATGRIGP